MIYDVVIVGGGVLGCATALRLAQRGRSVVILEKESAVAAHQTGHNSGVIHAGLYYKPGSLKAQTCTRGREALIAFCEEHGVYYERCGKLVVAVNESELPRLDVLEQRGRENGLSGMKRLRAEELREYEPHVTGIAGLHVAETGIVDYRAVTRKYADVAHVHGATLETGSRVLGIERATDEVVVETTTGTFHGKCLVTCAGLESDRICRLAGNDPGVRIVPFRGEYYEIAERRRSLVRNLIYPVPDPSFPFLGVHFTRRVDGSVEAGPNAVLALRREGYSKTSFSLRDAFEIATYPGVWRLLGKHWRAGAHELWRSWSKASFVAALQKLVPSIQSEDLEPAGAGVRAQAMRSDGSLVDDFHIVESARMVNVLNAPSPAATASLAIAETIEQRALTQLS